MTEAEAIARFSLALDEISGRGRAPHCAEQMAAIHAEHEAECARMRELRLRADKRERRAGR